MKQTVMGLLSLVALSIAIPAAARDDRLKFPVDAALAKGQNYKEKLDPQIKLYFGKPSKLKVAKTIGEWTSNKKTNAFNKSDQEACNIAFISAAVSLQDRAKREGGNAVINIHSVYKNDKFESPTEYLCGAGSTMAGVALRGTVVTLPK
ncbi:MAG: excinuclease ATPase subunit [Betaproteobacteria bacterium]|nr:MAG: excinuclease ATPase subunit [Betaproteobacteria bacterium]